MNAEEQIFAAAREIFQRNGFAGARMQDIADEAGINKAMLHYYYRSKEKLFEEVFRHSAMQLLPPLFAMLNATLPLEEKVQRFVREYIDILAANPNLPPFILHEVHRDPERLKQFMLSQSSGSLERFVAQVRTEVERGTIRPIAPEQFFTHLVGLCVFPFVARPLLQRALGLSDDDFAGFVQARKEEVVTFILNSLRSA